MKCFIESQAVCFVLESNCVASCKQIDGEGFSRRSVCAIVARGGAYDSQKIQFYELVTDKYLEVSKSRSFPGLIPAMLATAHDQSRSFFRCSRKSA